MRRMQEGLRKVKVQNGVQAARCAKNSRAAGKRAATRAQREPVKCTSALVGGKALVPRIRRVCCVFARAFSSRMGCDHAANINKLADPLGLVKPTPGVWGDSCLCARFCARFTNGPRFSTPRQRSADHEQSHTAKNLLGAISGISGEP